jgi:hypothetical protein
MRKEGRNPSIHVANVIGDAIHEINPDTALADALSLNASNSLKDRVMVMPPAHYPSTHERRCTVYHECGHVMGHHEGGTGHIEVRVRSDGSGICVASDVQDNPEANITTVLAGAFADIKFNPPSIHNYTHPVCADFLIARGLIDDLNAGRAWPKLSYRRASKNAMRFVEKHWGQIQNLALALNDAGELDDFSIRIFAKCQR